MNPMSRTNPKRGPWKTPKGAKKKELREKKKKVLKRKKNREGEVGEKP